MKILQVHNYYQQRGGEESVFEDERALLESRGHRVLRYTRHNDEIKHMRLPSVVGQTFWNRRTHREVRALLREQRPDIVHCQNLLHLVSPSVYYAAQAEGVPVVQTLHNFRLMCPNSMFARDEQACEKCLGKFFAWPGVRYACYRDSRLATGILAGMLAFHRMRGTWSEAVDQYIALSRFSRDKFIAGGLDPDRITVKPNFVFPEPPPQNGQGGYAVFVGRLSPEKGVSTLLDAWRLSDAALPLHIVGDGPLADCVASAARDDERIQWLGQQPHDEVYRQIGSAFCLVLPSICYENCPKTLIEAYALGTPVVASRTGALAEMVKDGESGLAFPTGDSAALATAVESVFANSDGRQQMREGARRKFEENYSAEVNYQALMSIYARAIKRKSGAPAPRHEPAGVSNY